MNRRAKCFAPRAVLLYHYFHPDDVVSARLFSDLAIGLTARGWQVEAAPGNRGCRDESQTYPADEHWAGGRIRRVWRPRFRQASNVGRLLNAAWMIAGWAVRALAERRGRGPEVLVVGTDPVLSVLATIPWRAMHPQTRVAHWCHDLYPEAPIADGLVRPDSVTVRVLRRLLAAAYRRCALIADLGPCMAERLRAYRSPAQTATLTPWALVEPQSPAQADPTTRAELFGNAGLGLLYSGSFGRAHSYVEFLDLARRLRGQPIRLCFAGRGNRMDELRASVSPDDTNITFARFAPESELEKRLGSCDLHLVSLRPEWTGTVVPSKFFGALAAGRGVVYAGLPDSAIARWIREYRVGWVLTPETMDQVAADLGRLAADSAQLTDLRARCHAIYQAHFSREHQLNEWNLHLRELVEGPNKGPGRTPKPNSDG
jgi:glycosyltransferase involved in cell wall biosynthesis